MRKNQLISILAVLTVCVLAVGVMPKIPVMAVSFDYTTANSSTIYQETVTGTLKNYLFLSALESDVDSYLLSNSETGVTSPSYELNNAIYNPVIDVGKSQIYGKTHTDIPHNIVYNSSTWQNTEEFGGTADSTAFIVNNMGSLQTDTYGDFLSWTWTINTTKELGMLSDAWKADDNIDSTVDGYSFNSNDWLLIVGEASWEGACSEQVFDRTLLHAYLGYGASTMDFYVIFYKQTGSSGLAFGTGKAYYNVYSSDGVNVVICMNLVNILNKVTGGSYTSGVLDYVELDRWVGHSTKNVTEIWNSTNDQSGFKLRQLSILEGNDPDGIHLLTSNDDPTNSYTFDILGNDTDGTPTISLINPYYSMTELKDLQLRFDYLTLADGIVVYSPTRTYGTPYGDPGAYYLRTTSTYDLKQGTEEPLTLSGTKYVNLTNTDSTYSISQVYFDDLTEADYRLFDGNLIRTGYTVVEQQGTAIALTSDLYKSSSDEPFKTTPKNAIGTDNEFKLYIDHLIPDADKEKLLPTSPIFGLFDDLATGFFGLPVAFQWVIGLTVLGVLVYGFMRLFGFRPSDFVDLPKKRRK